MATIARAHEVLRSVGLGIFKDFVANEVIDSITLHYYAKLRCRALPVGSLLGLLMMAHLDKGVDSATELLQRGWCRIRRRYGLRQISRPVNRSSFSRRLKTLPWEIFESIFEMTLASYAELVGPEQGRYKNLFTVQAIDGSVVNVAARLIRVWEGLSGRGGGRGRKAQARIHALYSVSWQLPQVVVIGGAKSSERQTAKNMLQLALKQPNSIVVFDLGYYSFALMSWIHRRDGFFVARMKEGTRYKILKRLGRRDWLVRVGGWSKGQASAVVRLVGVRESGQIYWYLTNLMPRHRITPTDVRELYRKRWMIEIFFKNLKHVLRGQKYFSYSTNGIKIQVYAALITYVVAKMIMAMAGQVYRVDLGKLSFQKTMMIMRLWMNERWPGLWCLRPRREHLDDLLCRVATYAHLTMRRQKGSRRRKRAA